MTGDFGPRGLQLVLLRRMADHRPELVEAALRELGADRAAVREANRHWQATLRAKGFPQGERRLLILLGPPEAREERRWGDVACRALRWPVPLWPRLRFEALVGPGGRVWNEWLVPAPGAAAPEPPAVPGEFAPWSVTVDEAARAFPGTRPREGDAPTRWQLVFPDGSVGRFTYGLLQEVTAPGGG